MSERFCPHQRRRLESSARNLSEHKQERILGTVAAEDEQRVVSNSDDETDGLMPPRLMHQSVRVLRRLLAGKANLVELVGFDVDGFLATRPARHWIGQIKQFGCQDRSALKVLQLLRGPVTFYEALCAMGPSMAHVAGVVQAVSQQRLFESCSVGFDMADWSVPLEALLRSGASLLRKDSHGRIAAHLAAAAESDVLGVVLHIAPAALLVEDCAGQTPLELLVDSPCLEQPGSRTGVKNALIDALLECLCAFPQQPFEWVQKSDSSLQVLKALAIEPGASALLVATSQGTSNIDAGKCVADVNKRCKKSQKAETTSAAKLRCTAQRIRVLEDMSSDSNSKATEFEAQDLQLRLIRLEKELQNQQHAAVEREAELEKELRRMKGLLAQREDELLTCRASVQAEILTGIQSSSQGVVGQVTESATVGVNKMPHTDQAANDSGERSKEKHEHSVIQEIRESRLVGVHDASLPESVRIGLCSMQTSLAAAVNRLAKDLYDSETHFIHEMLQNADDTEYAQNVVPEIRFKLGSSQLDEASFFYAASNEIGFREVDVRAICDISRSTKIGTSGVTTGHKGVGWKAVFRVCHAPHVLSGKWRFKFGSEGLGMITPEWISDLNYASLPAEVQQMHSEGWTVFFLPLTRSDTVVSILTELHKLENNTAQLIFFRRLRRICMSSAEQESQMDLLARPDHCATGLVEQQVQVHSKREKDQCKITTWSTYTHEGVTVACPLVEELSSQHIFAVLPVRKVGFNFAVQGQFQLTTSRADLHPCHENLTLRDAAAHAFLNLCRSSKQVAVRAFEYLGTEPADTFWLSARMVILGGLQAVACVPTEGGELVSPAQCLLRGDSRAAKWLSEDVLARSCGLKFVNPKARCGDLHDLGVQKFGFAELCKCVGHDNGSWMKAQWPLSTASAFFSDVFQQLAEDLQGDASRIIQVQQLRIFPVEPEEEYNKRAADHSSKRSSLPACELLHAATDVYAGFCPKYPDQWQMSLICRVSPRLQLTRCAQALLTLLGVSIPDEGEIEREALRWLLKPGSIWPCMRATWPALHVLCMCHSQGRVPPRPWNELRGALLLPSETGELLPPSCLRLPSFLGVGSKLPAGVLHSVCEFAGLDVQPLETHGFDLVKMPSQTELPWLEWEAFLWTLGCTYMNPMADFGEACVEATLELGRVLSSTAFWQAVASKPCVKAYIHATIGDLASPSLHLWLCQLPVGDGHAVLSDLFIREVFQTLGGNRLPYLNMPSMDPYVGTTLKKLGVAMDLDIPALFKCLQWMKAHAIQDIGLAAAIYEQLDLLGCTKHPPGASLIFIPGCGYLPPHLCCWKGFSSGLLQKCCELQPISEFYSRFGSGVQNLLARWVVPRPEGNAITLCNTLRTIIMYARQTTENPCRPHGDDPVDHQEALDGLCEGAQIIVDALAGLCNEGGADADMTHSGLRAMFEECHMIVVSGGSCNSRREPAYRLLNSSEAYWSVAPELHGDPCAFWQLRNTYGTDPLTEYFFVQVLGVRSVLHKRDKDRMTKEAGGKSGAAVVEGLTFERSDSPPSNTHFDLTQALKNALQRARGLREETLRSSTGSSKQKHGQQKHGRGKKPALEAPSSLADPSAVSDHGSGSTPTQASEEPCWQCIGEVGGFPLFSVNGVWPSLHIGPSLPNLEVLYHLCSSIGLEPDRLAFAYDPSGRCVGRARLFLNASSIPRVSELPPNEAAIFWAVELAQTIAHQGVGPNINQDLLAVMHELILLLLPRSLSPI